MKIREFFRLTLTKKIFVLILASFVVVEVIHAQAIITSARFSVERDLSSFSEDIGMGELAWDFYENYNSVDDNNFLAKIEGLGRRQVILLDKGMNVIDKELYMSDSDLSTTMVLMDNNDEYYNIVFKNEDREFLIKLESILKANLDSYGNVFEAYITVKHTKEKYTIDDISYFGIRDKVLIDDKDSEEKMQVAISNYVSPRLRLYPGDSEWYIDEEDTILKCISKLDNHYFGHEFRVETDVEDKTKVSNEYLNYFDEDGTMYFTKLIPLVSKGDLGEDYSIGESNIKGYLACYDVDTDSISQIYKNVIDDNKMVYIIDLFVSIVMSLIISMMLTKRVKKISAVTERIANNDFDVKLKERSHDELGMLSKNINSMSKQLNETISKLNEEITNVKKLESVRKEFIANFTHEIKTPLGIIDGYIELIEECKDDEKKKRYFEEINNETKRINELVLAMLNLSRLESGKVELHIQEIDIEDMITSTIDSFSSLLEKKNIKIKLAGENALIHADPFQLEMVIKNFMSNAIKHTLQDCYIEIIYNEDEISIENEGSLISEEQIEGIWDTYVSSDREGTGLGLAICKTILDLHGFKYKVENTDKGVRFTFTTKAPIN